MRWSHFFGQVAKVYSGVERRHWNDKEEAPFHGGFQEAGGVGGARERDTVQVIAARYEVHPNQVSAWKRQAVEGLDEVFSQPGSKRGGTTTRRSGICTPRSAS